MVYTLVSFRVEKCKEKRLQEYFKYTKVKYINFLKINEFLQYIDRNDNLVILVNTNLNIKYYKNLLEQKKEKTIIYIYINSSNKQLMYSLGADILISSDFDELELYKLFIFSCDALKKQDHFFENRYIHGDKQLYINLKTLDCFCNSKKVDLTKSEYKILFCLIEAQNNVVSRKDLLSLLSLENENNRVIDGIIKTLRKKIGKNRIYSVHNVGYALEKKVL